MPQIANEVLRDRQMNFTFVPNYFNDLDKRTFKIIGLLMKNIYKIKSYQKHMYKYR